MRICQKSHNKFSKTLYVWFKLLWSRRLSYRSKVVADVQWNESALQLPNTFKNQEGIYEVMLFLSFFHSYLLTCYVMWGYFSLLISDAKSIRNFPSKTQSFNNKFIFILHNNKWIWMKKHNFIHSSHCHVEFHCKLSDKSVNKRDHSENY